MTSEILPGEWPLVLSTGLLLKEPLISVLDDIKEAGFGSIEIASSVSHFDYHSPDAVSQLRKRLEDLNIVVNSFHAPYKDFVDLTLLDEKERIRAVKEVIAAAEALFALGGRSLVLHAGSEDESIPAEEVSARLKQAGKSLLEIYKHCQKPGLILAIEDTLAHLLGGKVEQVKWLVSKLPEKHTGICLDTGHSFLTGKLTERVRSFGPRLLMSHIHDNNGVYDDHLPPGDGKLPWVLLFRTFIEVGFKGPLILEIMGNEDIEKSLAGAARGAEFIRQLIYDQKTPHSLI